MHLRLAPEIYLSRLGIQVTTIVDVSFSAGIEAPSEGSASGGACAAAASDDILACTSEPRVHETRQSPHRALAT